MLPVLLMLLMFWCIRGLQQASDEQRERKRRVAAARSQRPELTASDRERHLEHREKYEHGREPLLDRLASDYDLTLFRQAQAKACEQLVSWG